LAAALLSGLSLILSGSREERRWQKDARVSTYQRFIELSFERSFKAVLGIRNRQGVKAEDLDKSGQEKLRREEWKKLALDAVMLTDRNGASCPAQVLAATFMLVAPSGW
jgi:hypothetical protein